VSSGTPTVGATLPRRPSLLVMSTVAGTIGGFLVPYADHFRALGWRVDAAAAGATSDDRVVAAFDHVSDLTLSRSVRDIRGLTRGRRAIEEVLETAPDIVHVHTPIAGFLARYVISRMPVHRRPAVVYTAHGFHFHEAGRPVTNATFLAAERVAGRWTDRLIVINDEDDAAARRHRIVAGRRLVHMPGIGLDTRRYSPAAVPAGSAARVRANLGIAPDAPVFVIVGEINRNKRQADAIGALGLLARDGAHLVLAGSGPERPRLESRAREVGVSDRVHFLGVVDDVRPVVRAATGLLLTSTREGLARSVMEALALEVPVIASTARGNRELVGEDSGLQFATGDVRGLARAMEWLIDHPDERRRMGSRGRARMVERYDIRLLLRMHEELYTAMLANRVTAPVGATA
jgi:glycosyltransferase involved in cell wall biosynthesis